MNTIAKRNPEMERVIDRFKKLDIELEALRSVAETAEKQVATWKKHFDPQYKYDKPSKNLIKAVENWQRIKGGEG